MRRKCRGSKVLFCAAVGTALSAAVGCAPQASKNEVNGANLVKAGNPNLARTIEGNYNILGKEAFRSKVSTGEILSSSSSLGATALRDFAGTSTRSLSLTRAELETHTSPQSLLFGMPISLLNTPMHLGSVITKVSDKNSESMGELKMADIPPLQVLPKISKDPNNTYFLALMNCNADCSATDQLKPLLGIPVVGVDSQKTTVYLDLAALGEGLDLVEIRKGDPRLAQFKSKLSETVAFDYSQQTLVFDVNAHLVDKDSTDANAPETVVTNRWYLKSGSFFNPKFVSRKPAEGVGYFTTDRSKEPLIQRWDFDRKGAEEGIKYYIKNVPQEYQASFAGAFDEWNEKFRAIIGKKAIDYEFISPSDPRNELLVAGDVRYNIVEWDLDNKAGYGGLGPSIANQFTGEIFHANILVQGPTIVELYTKWFGIQQIANELRANGRALEAERVLAKGTKDLLAKVNPMTERTFQLKLGNQIQMRIRSQDPALQDPLMSKDGFDEIPAGYDYPRYMAGYFHDMLAHEFGHTWGERHNFAGNLGADQDHVSRSVMEYLGRGYRHLDHIGPYDVMAVAYGYKGIAPEHTNWFCTDEDQATLDDPTKSAECTPNDATENPFDFFKGRLQRGVNLLVARGQVGAPEWSVSDMQGQLKIAAQGLGAYALSAEKTGSTWINFFNDKSRPTQLSEVKGYVLNQLKEVLCDDSLQSEISSKVSAEAQGKVEKNLTEFRAQIAKTLDKVYTSQELACNNALLGMN